MYDINICHLNRMYIQVFKHEPHGRLFAHPFSTLQLQWSCAQTPASAEPETEECFIFIYFFALACLL